MTTDAAPHATNAPDTLAALPIRRLTPADLAACVDLAADRGWPPEDHKWRLLLTAGQGYGIDAPPGDPHGGLVAAVVVTPYGGLPRGAAAHGDAISAIGMMLVALRCERRGLGARLLRHALAAVDTPAAFLTATSYGRPLYERLGFVSVGTVTLLRGAFTGPKAPAVPATPGVTDVTDVTGSGSTVRPAVAADLPALLAHDLLAFGADRTGLLTRLPSFADQFLVAEATPGGRLTGYAAAWPTSDTTVVGPLVADDLPTAQALLTRLAAAAPAGVPLRVDVDAGTHPAFAAWLRDRGLADAGQTALMVRGVPDLPGDATRRYAPYSVALG
ncbi:GNAT family N-acetyltransferase [Streptomyces sp. 4N509B]|uniref:GNAT family N-acetyltransferase n=1 Tax=Streptomyces sp. 4N509B TaxID=3457413 RepID=UPI003FD53522